ncbi:triose-phosphate isomerase [Sulfitobacter sp. D35]|uniref:triose-phosphate isomerase n=1 Tax=Sulfitobacter sp. D35 TaxID=3083252 RepID=UPI00296F9EEE|nr:triose-phosphate isomerase [Sulfitobacter sp. D35]MDW4496736.1 triose-phosphate isomerase [Sulfitobacter sp. D35]
MRRKLAAGNWKMNGSREALAELRDLGATHADTAVEILVCPPFPYLLAARDLTGTGPVGIGAQDCHVEPKGAHTGDVSAAMIADCGASHVIVGHSERREAHGESDETVLAKAEAAQAAGLVAIVCLGESLAQREAGETLDVIRTQLAGSVPDGSTGETLVVAYEPIWAIGTGKVPTLDQIAEVHADLRGHLCERFGDEAGNRFRLLYGGSVKPGNAAEIFGVGDVDGALVGGASLKASDFSPIVAALENA